jgi:molybdopterin synthase sulfur carrier subunit
MRDLTGGQERVVVEGATVRRIINNLETSYPGMKARLVDNDRIIPGMAVIVDGEVSRLGLLQRVSEESEVHFLPAIGGGGRVPPGG